MSVLVPETLTTSKSLVALTSITARPTMSVVDGPGGMSVGNKKTTLWPVSWSTDEPSVFVLAMVTAPFEGREIDFPFPTNVSAEPVPPLMIIPPVACGGETVLPPVPVTARANEHAVPAGKSTLKLSAQAPETVTVRPATARIAAMA